MKDLKKFKDIKPNFLLRFEKLYNKAHKSLNKLKKQLLADCNNKLSTKVQKHIDDIDYKFEQMVAKWKSDNKNRRNKY